VAHIKERVASDGYKDVSKRVEGTCTTTLAVAMSASSNLRKPNWQQMLNVVTGLTGK
jgi:hypothetical protein